MEKEHNRAKKNNNNIKKALTHKRVHIQLWKQKKYIYVIVITIIMIIMVKILVENDSIYRLALLELSFLYYHWILRGEKYDLFLKWWFMICWKLEENKKWKKTIQELMNKKNARKKTHTLTYIYIHIEWWISKKDRNDVPATNTL